MAATVITAYEADEDGVVLTYSAVTETEGDKFLNTERTCVHIKNASGVLTTATIQASGASTPIEGYGDVLLPNVDVVVAAGTEQAIMAPPARFNDSSGYCTVICTPVADVTICAVKLTKV